MNWIVIKSGFRGCLSEFVTKHVMCILLSIPDIDECVKLIKLEHEGRICFPFN